MRASNSHTLCIDLEDDEIVIFSELIKKLKETPSKIGFSRKSFTDMEQDVIDALYELMGHKANDDKVQIVAERDTVG